MTVRFPSLGDQLRLDADWLFQLHAEHRNSSLFAAVGRSWQPWDKWAHDFVLDVATYDYNGRNAKGWAMVSLPAQTVLRVDRIYLRQGVSGFNSITFRIVSTPDVRFRADIRFWAKLADCNAMTASWLDQPVPRQKIERLNKLLHMIPAHLREDGPAYGQNPPAWWQSQETMAEAKRVRMAMITARHR